MVIYSCFHFEQDWICFLWFALCWIVSRCKLMARMVPRIGSEGMVASALTHDESNTGCARPSSWNHYACGASHPQLNKVDAWWKSAARPGISDHPARYITNTCSNCWRKITYLPQKNRDISKHSSMKGCLLSVCARPLIQSTVRKCSLWQIENGGAWGNVLLSYVLSMCTIVT